MISPLARSAGHAGTRLSARPMLQRPPTIPLLLLILATAFLVAAPGLRAQQTGSAEVPLIASQLTRIYSAESQLRFPSLSPDGRWIAFSTSGDSGGGLWLVPAEGGQAIRLTQGHWDDGPVWFPSGDRIAFRSDRPARGGDAGSYVMSLAIDPETGQPTGPPRQVSIERCFAWLDVSPDGEWIAFSGWAGPRHAILVVPSDGGASRIVATAMTSRPVWAADGKSIYYTVTPSSGVGESLVRVSTDGAATDTVLTWPGEVDVFGYPQSRFVLRAISIDRWRDHPSIWEVATLDGRALGRLELPPGVASPFSFTPDGSLLAVRYDASAPLEVLPVDGGAPRRLNDTRGNDQVLGWSPDGSRVLFRTSLDGGDRFFFASADGGAMRQLDLPEEPLDAFAPVLSQDGRRLLYAVEGADSAAVTLKVLDLRDANARVITDEFFQPGEDSFELSGRGGIHWRDGDDFLYVRRHDDRFELLALPPSGPPRLLRAFGGGRNGAGGNVSAPPWGMAVYADRIAYVQSRSPHRLGEGHNSLVLARAGHEESRLVLTIQGVLESPTWSPDGKHLTIDAYRRSPEQDYAPSGLQLLVLEIGPSGEVMGEPTVLDTPDRLWWWSPQWLPDGRGLLVQAEDGSVWQVSSKPGIRPVELTADFPPNQDIWDFRISPDGRFIAYARSIFRGSSIWRVEAGDTLMKMATETARGAGRQ